ncbi:OmpA family protein [Methylobacterium trifolii]|uniref:Peptidoglycan-associated lipoprotein n=1 Tax=Methylobacterium trifolii TaxID=1003092 RepID=A0ABQ4U5L2_9HYPH|nr:OmpA family protein [Methylobacterium trifolii]GJE62710.1 Peptidoglycan-associated lipoprotein [Methylobacterium trifolii]
MTTPARLSLILPALALAGLAALAGAALADPSYKASDIVSHFSPGGKLGEARALCIGTETECAKQIPERSKPVDGFDLRINFDYNSATLTPPARANLDEFARALKDPQLSSSLFVVEGHTDGTGSDAFNLDLSMRRANAVVEYLKAHGVGGPRLEAKGYGKLKPLVPDPAASENRRVETRLRTD